MHHFDYLHDHMSEIFYKSPEAFNKNTDRDVLSYALGATLYMPAIRENIARDIISCKHKGLVSTVLCLEDAIGEGEIQAAEQNLVAQIKMINKAAVSGKLPVQNIPMIFIRVRNPEQMKAVVEQLSENAGILTGFVFPKFAANEKGLKYLSELEELNKRQDGPFYGMPILEGPEVIYSERRLESLLKIKELVTAYRKYILNIRLGATDFSGLFGIRRGPDITIYDIITIRDCLADILNLFTRAEDNYVVSGPVWEYFSNGGRLLKPQLRRSPFEEYYGTTGARIRTQLLNKYVDGLIREVILDKENGIIGKTIIHPSHILPVQSLYVVSHEEYLDALSIVNNNGETGVAKSEYTNKMNEIKPHLQWAKKILHRAQIYGVFHEQHNFTSILSEKI